MTNYEQYSKFELFMLAKRFEAQRDALMDVVRILAGHDDAPEPVNYEIKVPEASDE